MTTTEFVALWKQEKDELIHSCFNPSPYEWIVHDQLQALGLSANQSQQLRSTLDMLLTDAFYTILLALDGAASLGGFQQSYHLLDEEGEPLYISGELEAEAYRQFHGDDE